MPQTGRIYDLLNPVIAAAVVEIVHDRLAAILDCGCDTGRLAANLSVEHGHRVVGLDVHRPALTIAAARAISVVWFDLDSRTRLPFAASRFDGAILGDVIEHTRQPERVLARVSDLVKAGGFLIISVPNVAFVLTRIALLFGRFEYQDAGTRDRAHLRFFTRKTIVETVRNSGLEISSVRGYTARRSLRALGPLWRLLPGLFAYQYLVVARRPRRRPG